MQLTLMPDNDFKDLLSANADVIKVARVLCIFMMAYVHVHLFANEAFQNTAYFITTKTVLVELFGRSSVPLLSVISGFLMVGYFRRYSWRDAAYKRFIVLVIPLAVWNFMGINFATLTGQTVNLNLLNAILGLTDNAFYIHLTFLRDIFIVSVISPIIIYFVRQLHLFFLLAIIVYTYYFDLAPIIIRDQILLYFTAGVYIGVYSIPQILKSKEFGYIISACIIFLFYAQISLPYYPEHLGFIRSSLFDDLIRRPLCAILFWFVALKICQNQYFKISFTRYIEPSIYLMFLSHAFFIYIYGAIYSGFIELHNAPIYFMVWLVIPVACLISAILMHRALRLFPDIVSIAVSGKGTN